MRKICVFTGTRAEYGLLRSVMLLLFKTPGCTLQTIISGAHLSQRHGHTVDEIIRDGLSIDEAVEILADGDSPGSVCAAMGAGLTRYAETLERLNPDILLLLGDRFEAFAMAAAATVCRIPIAHIHGGETTEGAIDEAFRHSITKMSHLHFTACEEYRRRVMQLGENPERVWNVGSLGVENVLSTPLLPESAIRAELGFAPDLPYFVCTMHPVTLEKAPSEAHVAALCAALDVFAEYGVVLTGANADPGGGEINRALQQYAAARPNSIFVMSLGQKRYFSAVKHAACVLGNSSSGILEVPSIGVPVIDIGNRQRGRHRASAVLHSDNEECAITRTLRTALSDAHREFARRAENPFDRPGTAAAIVSHVCDYPLNTLLSKHFHMQS